MRYTKKCSAKYLREKYQYIIGWGGAGGEYLRFYNNRHNFLDLVVDSGVRGQHKIGTTINDMIIHNSHSVEKYTQYYDDVLIVIYPNVEIDILNSIYTYFPANVDFIMARLVDFGDDICYYSAHLEDVILFSIAKEMLNNNFSYLDIGVCHPVVRNNTYLFYENGFTNGVLIEPNSEMYELSKIYRPLNKTVNVGVTGGENSTLKYYYDVTRPGLNTFCQSLAKEREITNVKDIPVININEIIKENFDSYPDILDIYTEGMDFEILKSIDFEKYPIKIICAETDRDNNIYSLLKDNYSLYASTLENTIYVKKTE